MVNNLTGIIVPLKSIDELADGLEELIKSKAKADFFRQNAYKNVVENYTCEKISNLILDVYKSF